jgi:hypothetical protein
MQEIAETVEQCVGVEPEGLSFEQQLQLLLARAQQDPETDEGDS